MGNSLEKKVSLKLNMILNSIKSLMSVFFPLITFPYVSRILGTEQLGKYNFSGSIVNYFLLISALGIGTYATRECASIRNDKEKFEKNANQIFTINIWSTIFAYLLLFILMIFVRKLDNYKILIYILSLQIAFRTIGVEWIYNIYEDYKYITIRSIVFQILSLISLFLFVKSENDLCIYTMITAFSSGGANILNFFHSKKYCNLKLVKSLDLKKHLKPILILFAFNISATIYISSDVTILGFLKDDTNVGLYSVSTKIYTIVKSLLMSVLMVSIPRISYLIGRDDKKQINTVCKEIYSALFTIVLPAMLGIILLRKEIILLISGSEYIDASMPLMLLSISLVFSMLSYFWSQCILIPNKKDIVVLFAAILSSIINIILNIVLIPKWGINAAAMTTIISEMMMFIISMYYGKHFVDISTAYTNVSKSALGCGIIVLIVFVIRTFITNIILIIILSILLSVIAYIAIEIMLNNTLVCSFKDNIINKISKSRK